MGFLEAGTPLTWADSLEFVKYGAQLWVAAGIPSPEGIYAQTKSFHALHRPKRCPNELAVREHGIQQFINTYNRIKDRTNDVLKWGDEVRPPAWGRSESRIA